jgi:hypothetical protein
MNINQSEELYNPGLRLKLCDTVKIQVGSINEMAGIIYFVYDAQDFNSPFKLEEELLLRKLIIEYYGNVQDTRLRR